MRTYRTASLSWLVLGLLALYASAAGAQRGAAEGAVPRELVIALLAPYAERPGMMEAPQLLVGRVPEGLPSGVVPQGRGTAVLGALSYPTRGSGPRRSTIVVAVPDTADAALDRYARVLEQAGWRRPAAMFAGPSGFVPASLGQTLILCRDSAVVTAWAAPRARGGAHLRVSVAEGERRSVCTQDRRQPPFGDPDAPPFPQLTPPAGAEMSGGSGWTGSGDGSRETSTRLRGTSLSPAALVTHYTAQLRAAGWSAGDSLAGVDMAARVFEVRDARARRWRGILTAVALPESDERGVVLRLMRAGEDR